MEVVSDEIQDARKVMLAIEQEEYDLGMRKQSHNYACFRCGKMTHAKVGSERRLAYFCKRCWDMRCSKCGGKGVVKVNGIPYCEKHEIIPTIQMLAPNMKPDETPLQTIDRMMKDRIAELQKARSIEDRDAWIQDMLNRADWNEVRVKAWFKKGLSFWRMIVEKETKTFVWITFKERTCKLRKTELIVSALGVANVYLHRPFMEFRLELPIPTKKEND